MRLVIQPFGHENGYYLYFWQKLNLPPYNSLRKGGRKNN